MADITALKNRIRAAIKANDNQEITGPVLQQALLDIVDELNGATETEAGARQNGDSTLSGMINAEKTRAEGAENTLQQNITAEKNRAEGAENTLQQNITAEKNRAEGAESVLRGLIDGITENIENGYMYAGIATPSSTPATGKVFYLALTAGTYTNFGNTEVSQGINILKYNGSVWSNQQLIGIDDEPTAGSNNLVKSGGVREELDSKFFTFINQGTSVRKALDGILELYIKLPDSYIGDSIYLQRIDRNYGTTGSFLVFRDATKLQHIYNVQAVDEDKNIVSFTSNNVKVYAVVDWGKFPNNARKEYDVTLSDAVYDIRNSPYIMAHLDIDAEGKARQTADQTLQENIDAEGKARQTADQTLQEKVETLNKEVNEVRTLASDVNLVHTALDAVKTNIAATEIFKGVYDANGNLITRYDRYSALYPVEFGKLYLYTNTDYAHVGVAAFDLVFLDSSRNFIEGIPRGTQSSYSSYPITITNPSIAYIAAISGTRSTSNASSLKEVVSYVPKMIEPPESVIQEQFRLLDFSSFTGDKQPYYESIIFAAFVWKNGNKPEWAVKPEIYAVGYNNGNNDEIEVAIEIGNDGDSNKSMWIKIANVSQLNKIPKYYFTKKIGLYGDFYVIFSPKAIVDYYNAHHESIIHGGAYGTHVCTEELTSDDPRLAMFNVASQISAINTRIDNVASQISAINTRIDNIVVHPAFWNNKKMVWYGTSIPAGSDPTLGQEGIGITYPEIAANYLGATCNNEAVGSGRASYLAPVQNETYQHLMRCQGGTIASKLALFNDIYVIDDDNETVTLGPNTYNVNELPVSGTPTYAQAVSLRLEAIRFSYEIKLISRYLDSTNQYLQDVLNSQEVAASIHYTGGTGYELLHRTDMDYKFTPDLFVFDHGTNDYGHMSNNDDVTTRDTTKFYGAMNMMYDLIQFYAPKSLVCIVTDYGTSRYNSDLIINEQQAWANYWQIPCLRTCDIVPWNGTVITVQGYWDGTTAQGGQWHDDGFYFIVNGDAWETNNGIILRAYNSSTPASTIISRYNIRTIRGKQVYDIQQKYKFFKDGLHPHTDTSGNALKLYARYLSRLISTQVAPNKD